VAGAEPGLRKIDVFGAKWSWWAGLFLFHLGFLFRRNDMASYLKQFSSPASKLVRFFEKSRDRWKAKQRELKKSNKKLLKQTRAVEKSREVWRQRAQAAEHRVAELACEIERLKCRRQSASPDSPRGTTGSASGPPQLLGVGHRVGVADDLGWRG
jgi:hypothetical protein